VDVRINKAREDEFAGSVDYFGVRWRFQVAADGRNLLIFRVDVSVAARVGGDNLAIPDE
jgi:hypothetical protein